jgi:hypothetical protein
VQTDQRLPLPATDVLHWPAVGRALRWRWGRLAAQLALLAVASLMIYDGFSGDPIAAANLSTILGWVEYRGLILIGLLLVGNVFCFACPFTLLRTLAVRLSLRGPRWPRILRTKWLSLAALALFFWLYEWADLWARPSLTAWLIIIYFGLSFGLEALFHESPFCKWLCPIGAFNYTYSLAAPLIIQPKSRQVCHACPGKECVRGRSGVAGCGTELYVPVITTNQDCTFCLDCVRACPFDNVALRADGGPKRLLQPTLTAGWDRSALLVALALMGFANAFGMVPPAAAIDRWLGSYGVPTEGLRLLILFALATVALPAALVWMLGALSTLSGAKNETARRLAARYAPSFVPMGIGIWLAHYGFHFAIGALTVVPAFQAFVADHGWRLADAPNWRLGPILPVEWIFPMQVAALAVGFLTSVGLLARLGLQQPREPLRVLVEILPWAAALALLAASGLWVFSLPMQPRGGPLGGLL